MITTTTSPRTTAERPTRVCADETHTFIGSRLG